MENLDKMFPDGYIVVYTCDDGQIRLSLYNPHKDNSLEGYHRLLKDSQ